jgi:hypothetical protein
MDTYVMSIDKNWVVIAVVLVFKEEVVWIVVEEWSCGGGDAFHFIVKMNWVERNY